METEPEKDKLIISPIAYIKSLMYFQRFSSDFIESSSFKFAYGLLIGFIDPFDKSINVEDFIPLKEFEDKQVRFKEYDTIFTQVNKLNEEHDDEEYPEYILGWARNSVEDDIEPTLVDKENHLFFQTAINPRAFFWVFNHENLAIDLGFRLYAFEEDFKQINITSKLKELSYTFSKDVYLDDFIQLAIEIELKRKNSEPLLKGRKETESKPESDTTGLLGVKLG